MSWYELNFDSVTSHDQVLQQQATDPAIKKIAEQIRQYPKRSLPNVFTVDDIAALVKDKQALLIVSSSLNSRR